MKEKLKNVENDVMKFFEVHNCPVCLSNYKEILDEDLHIVVSTCGHPLCCKCADRIVLSSKKECPRCKVYIGADFGEKPFRLMKFDAGLKVDAEEQKLFL